MDGDSFQWLGQCVDAQGYTDKRERRKRVALLNTKYLFALLLRLRYSFCLGGGFFLAQGGGAARFVSFSECWNSISRIRLGQKMEGANALSCLFCLGGGGRAG